MDDDCLLNINKLLDFCDKALPFTIYGHLWKKAFVDRNQKSKFFISRRDYPANAYPDYTGGPWLMPNNVVRKLYETAITKSLPALPFEDVYITGVVAHKLAIKRQFLPGLVYFNRSLFKKLDFCWFNETIIFWQDLNDKLLVKGWTNIMNSKTDVCPSHTTTTANT